MWGNRGRGQWPVASGRSIPACAGEPSDISSNSTMTWVYPRVCGGTSASSWIDGIEKGLSPRLRGNLRSGFPSSDARRSIPACAGEPGAGTVIELCNGVYPRVCGGTRRAKDGGEPHRGLSPRVRGNQARMETYRYRKGSIPACAGEPGTNVLCSFEVRVYPRVCGGTASALRGCLPASGLSPRVRGNLAHYVAEVHRHWSIPACAGEPSRHSLSVA